MKGLWEPVPHQVTNVVHNQITGTRDHCNSTRDRSDWKLVKERPEHLQFPFSNHITTLPTIHENVFEEEDMWDDMTPRLQPDPL